MVVFQHDYHTEGAGGAITEVIPPADNRIARATSLVYKTGLTGHTLTFLRVVAQSTVSTRTGTGQANIEVIDVAAMLDSAGQAETQASGDWCVYQRADGTYEANSVSAASFTILTMNNNIGGILDAGAPIWFFGELTRGTQVVIDAPAGGLTTLNDLTIQGSLPGQLDQHNRSDGVGRPMLFHSNNTTNDGFLKHLSGEYADAADVSMT